MMLNKYNKEKKVFSVSELTSFIKIHLESKFPTLYIEGEVSNLTFQSSGHVYFTLKDSGASISCVMFRSSAKNGSEFLQRGKQVCVVGSLRVYEPRGSYQIVASRVELKGQGALFAEFEKRKKDYETRGWFDPEIKKKLPTFPKKIAIITSPTGAVIRDFWNVIQRRQANGLSIHLYPVRVQGDQAAREIKEAIELINEKNEEELIVLARGGGSIEDLWAFNQSAVVEAIFYSKLPIISAIGHETDFTLSDFVADVRASTPSVAGELAVPDSKGTVQQVQTLRKSLQYLLHSNLEYKTLQLAPFKKSRLSDFFLHQIEKRFMDLDYLQRDLNVNMIQLIEDKKNRLIQMGASRDLLIKRLSLYLERQKNSFENQDLNTIWTNLILEIQSRHLQVQQYGEQVDYKMTMILLDKKQKLDIIKERLMAHSPEGILKKGYTLLSQDNQCIYSVEQLELEGQYDLQFGDGKAHVIIKEKFNGKEK